MTHVYEFDARIKSDLTRVSSKVNGTIDKILVNEGDQVKVGDLLIIMNGDGINHQINALDAELNGQKAKTKKFKAQKLNLNVELDAQISTKNEEIKSLKVELKALLTREILAIKKLERTKYLVSKNLTSKKNLDIDQDYLLNLSGQVYVSEAEIKVAQMELMEIIAKRSKIDILDQDIIISDMAVRRLVAQLQELEVELEERRIRSPVNGIVDIVFKNQGEYIEDASEILVLHDPENIWIEANIEENQIRHLQLGQPVKIDFNAYPFNSFKGEVIYIGRVTLSDLAMPKADLGDSRSRKLVQRIPVKIKLIDKPEITAPGMLAEVNIQIQDKGFLK
ncbi:MAG: HlyD family secretion protein [Rhodospirillaceae bacterium]|nr:HlyD family secretion protein [Rhodospirillaceae bacterium]